VQFIIRASKLIFDETSEEEIAEEALLVLRVTRKGNLRLVESRFATKEEDYRIPSSNSPVRKKDS
jgi:hypothetical protein